MKTAFVRPLALTALVAASAAPLSAAEGGGSLLHLIEVGGWAMWPLGLCSILVCYLLLWIGLDLRPTRFLPGAGRGDFARRLLSTDSEEPPVEARLATIAFRECVERWREAGHGPTPDEAATALDESLGRLEARYTTRIHYLNVIAAVAPMIGLLGTVSGMIGAFQTISGGGMGRAEMLAGDIGEALVTTASGLVVGIPAMLGFFFLKARLQALVSEATRYAERIADQVRLSAAGNPE